MFQIERPAVIDIGSNSVRLVIYEDYSSSARIFYNEKFTCKLGKLTSEKKISEPARDKTLKALERFKKISQANNVTNLKAIATAGLRDAIDGRDFARFLTEKTGLQIDIISGEDEAYYATKGVSYMIPEAVGCVCDLGGGSLEMAYLQKGVIGENRVSLPLGGLRIQQEVGEICHQSQYREYIQTILAQTDFDKFDTQILYCVGGSWRALMRLYMRHAQIPLQILQGFEVASEEMIAFCQKIISEQINIHDPILTDFISKRRRALLPLTALLLKEILNKYHFKKIIMSTSGIREGVLISFLSDRRQCDSSALSFAMNEASLRARNPNLYPHFIRMISEIIPNLSPRHLLMVQIIVYLSDIAFRGHIDFRAAYAFDFVLYAHLDDLTHQERIIVAAATAWRYDPDFKIPDHLLSYIEKDERLAWTAKAIALALRYIYSLSGISYIVAQNLSFNYDEIGILQHHYDGDPEHAIIAGETADKRYQALLKWL